MISGGKSSGEGDERWWGVTITEGVTREGLPKEKGGKEFWVEGSGHCPLQMWVRICGFWLALFAICLVHLNYVSF